MCLQCPSPRAPVDGADFDIFLTIQTYMLATYSGHVSRETFC